MNVRSSSYMDTFFEVFLKIDFSGAIPPSDRVYICNVLQYYRDSALVPTLWKEDSNWSGNHSTHPGIVEGELDDNMCCVQPRSRALADNC